MFAHERHVAILALLSAERRVSASELAERFSTTRETIRRDLSLLEAEGSLRRVHGGAVPSELSAAREEPLDRRQEHNIEQKNAIARAALSLIPSQNSSIIIDAGTTTTALARLLAQNAPASEGSSSLAIITHALPVALEFSRSSSPVRLEMVGGFVRPMTLGAVGPGTVASYRNLRADIAFVGTNAVTTDFGLSTPDAEEAEVKSSLMKAARRVIVLADAEKFGDACLHRFARFEDIDTLVTTLSPPEALRRRLEEADVDVVLAGSV